MVVSGFRIQDKIQVSSFKFQVSGFKNQDSRFRIQDSSFKFQVFTLTAKNRIFAAF